MLAFKEQGQGPDLVLLHGFCETKDIWDPLLPLLQAHFRCICMDMPGFGASDWGHTPFGLADVAAEVHEFIMHQGLQKPIIIGHSLGGYVCLALVEKWPELAQAFCLFHSSALADGEEKKANRNRTIEFVKKNGVAALVDSFVEGLFYAPNRARLESEIVDIKKMAAQTPDEVHMAYTAAMRDRPDRTKVLRDFNGPMLFLAGEEDGAVPFQLSLSQAQLSPQLRFEALPGVGHMGMVEATQQSAEILLQWARENHLCA
ncbi:MAG: alpha/beta fold hydrolase [Cytophagales bacterium]|nr:alpha/beta fold hydrolase [Cytophagales bacterium]